MGPSVRVKRRHPYASIQEEGRTPEQPHDDQLETGRRTLSEPGAALSPNSTASGSLHPSVPPHDPTHPSPSHLRRDMSRVNRLARSSISYRSFASDPESNPSDSPRVPYGRLDSAPISETIHEGTSTDAAGPPPHRAHAQRVSRVRSALSSTPSRGGESDSESDSEDEDRIMEDDEHHHDDDVVDHLDVIGSPSPIFCLFLAL